MTARLAAVQWAKEPIMLYAGGPAALRTPWQAELFLYPVLYCTEGGSVVPLASILCNNVTVP
jgi:hypothetical protein